MDIELEHLVIHELRKSINDREARKKVSSDTLAKTTNLIEFVGKLHDIFQNRGYNFTHAVFDTAGEKRFPNLFNEMVNSNSKESFLEFTSIIMDDLVNEVKNTNAVGGYIVFSIYRSPRPYFMINIVRETNGFRLSDDDPDFILPEMVEHLDLDKLTMSCQIDLDKYRDNNDKYIRLTNNSKLSDLRDYFYQWLAIDEGSKSNTRIFNDKLIDIISSIEPLPVMNGRELSRDDFKKQCLSFINSQDDKMINMKSLGEFFYPENSNTIIEYAQRENLEIDSEFKRHPQVLKKLWKFDEEADNIRLAFKYDDKDKIEIIDESRIIIRSMKLVETLRIKFLEQNDD